MRETGTENSYTEGEARSLYYSVSRLIRIEIYKV